MFQGTFGFLAEGAAIGPEPCVALPSRLRVPAASRRQDENGAGRPSNPQARTARATGGKGFCSQLIRVHRCSSVVFKRMATARERESQHLSLNIQTSTGGAHRR